MIMYRISLTEKKCAASCKMDMQGENAVKFKEAAKNSAKIDCLYSSEFFANF